MWKSLSRGDNISTYQDLVHLAHANAASEAAGPSHGPSRSPSAGSNPFASVGAADFACALSTLAGLSAGADAAQGGNGADAAGGVAPPADLRIHESQIE